MLLGKFKCGHLWAREFTSAPRFTSYIRGKKIWYSLANFRLFRISPSNYSTMLLFYSYGVFEDSENYKLHSSWIFGSTKGTNMWLYVVKRKSIKLNEVIWELLGKNKEFQKLLWGPCCKQILLLNINMKYFTTYEN